MSSTEITQAKADAEAIIKEVLGALEEVIAQYRLIYMQHQDDVMSDQLFAFCDEMEGLKSKIQDNTQKLTDRIENVGHISEYIADLLKDERAEENNESNKIIAAIDSLTMMVTGSKTESENFAEASDSANLMQSEHEKFFVRKKAELNQLLTQHPELKNS